MSCRDEYEFDSCPKCGSSDVTWEQCWACFGEGGFHDCGEDCCCCLHPEMDLNETCDECDGDGGYQICHQCAADALRDKVDSGSARNPPDSNRPDPDPNGLGGTENSAAPANESGTEPTRIKNFNSSETGADALDASKDKDLGESESAQGEPSARGSDSSLPPTLAPDGANLPLAPAPSGKDESDAHGGAAGAFEWSDL